jgi:hypothetical protein
LPPKNSKLLTQNSSIKLTPCDGKDFIPLPPKYNLIIAHEKIKNIPTYGFKNKFSYYEKPNKIYSRSNSPKKNINNIKINNSALKSKKTKSFLLTPSPYKYSVITPSKDKNSKNPHISKI